MNANIILDYAWTLSPQESRRDVPMFSAIAYPTTDVMFAQQIKFYVEGIEQWATQNPDNIYGNLYKTSGSPVGTFFFPYFTDTYLNVSSDGWESIDGSEGLKKIATGVAGLAGGKAWSEFTENLIDGAVTGATIGAALTNPKVGVMDRPALFSTHPKKTISVKFPLYNTHQLSDVVQNIKFIEEFATLNLFKKTSFFTGIPPCFYRLEAPHNYYCYAAYVSNFQVANVGNMRRMNLPDGNRRMIPDIFEISIDFAELIMPSLNQFEKAIDNVMEIY